MDVVYYAGLRLPDAKFAHGHRLGNHRRSIRQSVRTICERERGQDNAGTSVSGRDAVESLIPTAIDFMGVRICGASIGVRNHGKAL